MLIFLYNRRYHGTIFKIIRMNKENSQAGVDFRVNFLFAFLRMAIASSSAGAAWLILFFGYNFPLGLATAYAFGGGAALFGGLQLYTKYRYLKSHQLTRTEYAFIKRNLREAKQKIKRLRKTYMNVRSFRTFNQVLTSNRLVKKIYSIVKKEPKRFYRAEKFFFYHLDSMVELTEKHTFLSAQSVKDRKINESLTETKRMIDELNRTVEQDLHNLLASDVDHLNFEIDVAKHSLTTWSKPLGERRSEK